MTQVMAMLTLRPGAYVYYAEHRLVIVGWWSTAVVRCPSVVEQLWLRLEPLLAQGLDPFEVTGLPDAAVSAVRWLVGLLTEHQVLVDATVLRSEHPLAPFLTAAAQEPATALAAVRRSVVAVEEGEGWPADAIRESLDESGITVGVAADADLTVRPGAGPRDGREPGGRPVLWVTQRADGILIGPSPAGGAGRPAASRCLPAVVAHEVVRTLAGLADGTGALLHGTQVRRVRADAKQQRFTNGSTVDDAVPTSLKVLGTGSLAAAVLKVARTAEGPPRRLVVGAAPEWSSAEHRAAEWEAHDGSAGYLAVRGNGASLEIGPLSRAPGRSPGGPCLACVDNRRAAVTGAPTGTGWGGGRLPLPPYLLGIVGDLIVGHLSGSVDPRSVTVLGVRDGTILRYRAAPIPGCRTCAPLPDDGPDQPSLVLRNRPMAAPDQFRVAARPPRLHRLRAALVDPRYGPVVRVHTQRWGPAQVAGAELAPPRVAGPGPVRPRFGGFGRAIGRPAAETLALLEALERDAGHRPQARETVVRGSYRQLAERAVDPAWLGLPEPAAVAHPDYRLARYDPDVPVRWVWADRLTGSGRLLVPEDAAFWDASPPADRFLLETSSGCAIGSCREEAILHGCLEVIERDAFLLTWYARRPPVPVTLPADLDRMTRMLCDRIAAEGYTLHLLDITTDVGVPAIWALAVTDLPDLPASFSAAGANPDPARAVAAAVAEAGVNLLRSLSQAPADRSRLVPMLDDSDLVRDMDDHAALYQLPEALPRFGFAFRAGAARPFEQHFAGWRERWTHFDLTEVLRRVAGAMAAAGLAPLVVDQTRQLEQRFGLAAVKVVAPGAVPMTFGHLYRRVELPRLRLARDGAPPDLPHPFP